MVVSFLAFQETKNSPENTQNPIVNLCEFTHETQLESEKAYN